MWTATAESEPGSQSVSAFKATIDSRPRDQGQIPIDTGSDPDPDGSYDLLCGVALTKTTVSEGYVMKSRVSTKSAGRILLAFLVAALFCTPAVLPQATAQGNQKPPAAKPPQRSFATPDEAAKALMKAAEDFDLPALMDMLGPDGQDLVSSGDPVQDKNYILAFAARAKEKNSVALDPSNPNRAILSVGDEDWPLPVPMVKKAGKWRFDSRAGRNEVLFRRIGANELNAIQVCRGFVEAQMEYASDVHDASGIHQYAQRLMSSPGKQDGLYWTNADGTPGGPVSEAVARAIEEGYTLAKDSAYHGYYFHLLKGQGPAAPMGQLDYIIKGMMIGGFALIAVPAEYGVTGVQTFIVSNDGIVYQKDLGPDSLNLAQKIERYNPDKTWRRTDDEWAPGDFQTKN